MAALSAATTDAPDPGELLTIRQASIILGISYPYTLRAMISGRLPSQRVGREYRTTRRDVYAYRPSHKATRTRALPSRSPL